MVSLTTTVHQSSTWIDGDQVVISGLSENERLGKPGVWGLESENVYGRVFEITAEEGDQVTRRLVTYEGAFNSGDDVRIDTYSYDVDPAVAHDLDFETVLVGGSLGELPAWLVPGNRDTWVIFVHGRRASRQEALRLLPVAVEQDFTSLVISFRGDRDVDPDPRGYYGYGVTEWPDLEAAAQYAIDNGASGLILVGYSMGGGIVMSFMAHSELADQVVGLVLDAPMLDFGLTIDHNAASKDLPLVGLPVPGPMTDIAKWIAATRFDIDWEATDYTDELEDLSVPVLLFHGEQDPTVPVKSSRDFAEQRPDIVSYTECEGAVHVGCWNSNPTRYESAASEFLAQFKD